MAGREDSCSPAPDGCRSGVSPFYRWKPRPAVVQGLRGRPVASRLQECPGKSWGRRVRGFESVPVPSPQPAGRQGAAGTGAPGASMSHVAGHGPSAVGGALWWVLRVGK